jgi:hypothetical protein
VRGRAGLRRRPRPGPRPGLRRRLRGATVDAAILREALLVRYARAQGVGIALGTWVPYGPEGGIVGGAWTASIQVP